MTYRYREEAGRLKRIYWARARALSKLERGHAKGSVGRYRRDLVIRAQLLDHVEAIRPEIKRYPVAYGYYRSLMRRRLSVERTLESVALASGI